MAPAILVISFGPSSRLDRLKEVMGRSPAGSKVELMPGDLLSREDGRQAAEGISVVLDLQKRGRQRSEFLAQAALSGRRHEGVD